jgi:hypothetical protein
MYVKIQQWKSNRAEGGGREKKHDHGENKVAVAFSDRETHKNSKQVDHDERWIGRHHKCK